MFALFFVFLAPVHRTCAVTCIMFMKLSTIRLILKYHFKYSKVVTVAIKSCRICIGHLKSCKYIIWIDMDNEINSYVTNWNPCLDIIWLDLDITLIYNKFNKTNFNKFITGLRLLYLFVLYIKSYVAFLLKNSKVYLYY